MQWPRNLGCERTNCNIRPLHMNRTDNRSKRNEPVVLPCLQVFPTFRSVHCTFFSSSVARRKQTHSTVLSTKEMASITSMYWKYVRSCTLPTAGAVRRNRRGTPGTPRTFLPSSSQLMTTKHRFLYCPALLQDITNTVCLEVLFSDIFR